MQKKKRKKKNGEKLQEKNWKNGINIMQKQLVKQKLRTGNI